MANKHDWRNMRRGRAKNIVRNMQKKPCDIELDEWVGEVTSECTRTISGRLEDEKK